MWLRHPLVTLAVALGCGQAAHVPSDSTSSSTSVAAPTAEAASVTIATDSSSVGPGSHLAVSVKVVNTGRTPLVLHFSSGCQTDFEIQDAQGNPIGRSGMMCTEALTQRALEPGASFTNTHIWVRGMRGVPQAPAGAEAVRIRGVLLATSGEIVSRNTVSVALR
jgi:Intracellular proteinase inhibitor